MQTIGKTYNHTHKEESASTTTTVRTNEPTIDNPETNMASRVGEKRKLTSKSVQPLRTILFGGFNYKKESLVGYKAGIQDPGSIGLECPGHP